MNPIDDTTLNDLLVNNGKSIFATESVTLEYKSDFDWTDKEKRAKYCKSIAALCNNSGGYLVFGIDDSTMNIIGLSDFDKMDTAKIVDHLNNYFAPSITIHKRSIILAGKAIGIIYVEKYKNIPSICVKSYESILKDGTIYYRYPAKSEAIKGTDLIHLLHQLKGADGREMVDLKKQEMKINAEPRFIFRNSIGQGSNTAIINLLNNGKVAKVNDIKSITNNINVWSQNLPKRVEHGGQLVFNVSNVGGAHIHFSPIDLEIYYDDSIGTHYKVHYIHENSKTRITDPEEL